MRRSSCSSSEAIPQVDPPPCNSGKMEYKGTPIQLLLSLKVTITELGGGPPKLYLLFKALCLPMGDKQLRMVLYFTRRHSHLSWQYLLPPPTPKL